ncbi:MAG: hypothetical protein CMK07_00545 [Ponticaulis sp.]|nr:hypothetical protein [Ponticaulis sp.]
MYVKGKTLYVCGMMTEDFADQVPEIDFSKLNEVAVGSPGGLPKSSILIGRAIKEHDLPVIIIGLCLSGCANSIAPAAREIWTDDQSIIGFHHSAVVIAGLSKIFLGDIPEEYSTLAKEEIQFAEELNINTDYLIQPLSDLTPRRVNFNPDFQRIEEYSSIEYVDHDIVVYEDQFLTHQWGFPEIKRTLRRNGKDFRGLETVLIISTTDNERSGILDTDLCIAEIKQTGSYIENQFLAKPSKCYSVRIEEQVFPIPNF